MSYMGIDIGTTGCKAIIFSRKGGILANAYREYPLFCPRPGWAELEPLVIYNAVCEAVSEAVKKTKDVGVENIQALCFSTQGAGPIPLDVKGEPLYNCITALDVRSKSQVEFWEERLGRERLYGITGMPLHTLYSINQLMWIKENSPKLYGKINLVVNPAGYIIHRWGMKPVIDRCVASSTMVFDITKGRWSHELLEIAGIDPVIMPDLISPGEKIGELPRGIAENLGLPEGLPVFAGGHDQACAALGSGVFKKGVALDSTGTVEAIVPVWDKPLLTTDFLQMVVLWDIHVVPNRYLGIAANFSAGSVLRWFRDTLRKDAVLEACENGVDVYELILPTEDWTPSPIFVLPHFSGSFSPWCDPLSKGAMLGLRLDTTDEEIALGIVESVTYEAKLIIDRFENGGTSIDELRSTGGVTRQPKWLQLKADIFEKPIAVPDVTEAACLGAALLTAYSCGEFNSIEEGIESWVKLKKTYFPRPEYSRRYIERYSVYKEIYPTLKKFNHMI